MTDDPSAPADHIRALRDRMEAASAALDFDEARRLRDEIGLLRGGASPEDARSADTGGLDRQKPGRMDLGTSQQRMTPPADWKRPQKPDPMTKGRSRRPHGRRD